MRLWALCLAALLAGPALGCQASPEYARVAQQIQAFPQHSVACPVDRAASTRRWLSCSVVTADASQLASLYGQLFQTAPRHDGRSWLVPVPHPWIPHGPETGAVRLTPQGGRVIVQQYSDVDTTQIERLLPSLNQVLDQAAERAKTLDRPQHSACAAFGFTDGASLRSCTVFMTPQPAADAWIRVQLPVASGAQLLSGATFEYRGGNTCGLNLSIHLKP